MEHAQGPELMSFHTLESAILSLINLRTCMVIATNITSGLCEVASKKD